MQTNQSNSVLYGMMMMFAVCVNKYENKFRVCFTLNYTSNEFQT